MTSLTGNLRDIASWEVKPRYDSVTDQYSRIFMTKLFFICSLICGMNYFNDKITCLVSKNAELSSDFVQASCWITGFYVYHDMHNRTAESAYYGIPENMDYDGIDEKRELCTVLDRAGKEVKDCVPMQKRYFVQYQWIVFYVASLSILYYVPYVAFKIVNSDLISLVDSLRDGILLANDIANNYFNYKVNSKSKMRIRIFANLFVKMLYIGVNIGGFMTTDLVLEGRFIHYGVHWCKWNMAPNNITTIDMTKRIITRPGNHLLPPWGFCNLHEAVRDARTTTINRHKLICEVSSNLIYQYVFIVLWFFFTIGMSIALLGWFLLVIQHVKTLLCIYKPAFQKGTLIGEMYALLTLREIEYLEIIRRNNLSTYGDVMRKLTKQRHDMFSLKRYFDDERALADFI